ncbi:uncharacterized protein LOC143022318 [Oratosquilla oratoria]|uniref:uncharacterized protein LOC143022318 n=1 Tax=Oratosquilla oratoria TaxID=337810 RepID=UPI003F7647BF
MTTLLVYCMMLVGVGYIGANKLISFFSLKHFTRHTYIRYARYITETATDLAKSVMEKSRRAVCDHYASKQDVEKFEGKFQISTTFDGTWHKRGHKSNFGIGAVIDVETRLILDYEVRSKICFKCNAKAKQTERGEITATEYAIWFGEHDCDKNYEGPSGGMEAAAAVSLWGRSCQYDIIYKTFVSDGDSSAFRSVCGMNQGAGPYGEQCPVVKAECINHVAKRLGTGLRALKKKVMQKSQQHGEEDIS